MSSGPRTGPGVGLRLSRLVLLIIVTATAIPARLGPPAFTWWLWHPADVLGNILLYVPLGWIGDPHRTAPAVVRLALGVSTTVEIAQLFYANRTSHPSDVAANVAGALAGWVLAARVRLPERIGLRRGWGAAMLLMAAGWIATTRAFLMYVGGFGWFAQESQPAFWPLLPHAVIAAGVTIHDYGALVNTVISGLLAAGGVIGLLQLRGPVVRAAAAGLSGFVVGTVIMPHLNVFPVAYTAFGAAAGLAMSACVDGGPPPRQ